MKPQIFVEGVDLTEATIDKDNRVLRDVILIRAGESLNKRDYPQAVLETSVPVFEGVKAYADHPTRESLKQRSERSIRDITGWYANVRYVDGALRADRHFAPTQAGQDAWALAEMVASGSAPKNLAGLSINAVGRAKKRDDGGIVVEAITHAHSVDDVTTPAAGGGYIESASDDLTEALLEAMTFEEWRDVNADYRTRLQKEYQTVRLDEETKTSLAEAAEQVKAAADEAGALRTTLQETQAQVTALETELAEARAQLAQAEAGLAIEKLVTPLKFSKEWDAKLREDLAGAEVANWQGIVERYKQLAKGAFRPPVDGAGQQVNKPLTRPTTVSVEAQIREALARVETPEEQARLLQQLREHRRLS